MQFQRSLTQFNGETKQDKILKASNGFFVAILYFKVNYLYLFCIKSASQVTGFSQ